MAQEVRAVVWHPDKLFGTLHCHCYVNEWVNERHKLYKGAK